MQQSHRNILWACFSLAGHSAARLNGRICIHSKSHLIRDWPWFYFLAFKTLRNPDPSWLVTLRRVSFQSLALDRGTLLYTCHEFCASAAQKRCKKLCSKQKIYIIIIHWYLSRDLCRQWQHGRLHRTRFLKKIHPFLGWRVVHEPILIPMHLFLVHKYFPIRFHELLSKF